MGNPPWGIPFPKDDEIPVRAEIQGDFDALQFITSIFYLPQNHAATITFSVTFFKQWFTIARKPNDLILCVSSKSPG